MLDKVRSSALDPDRELQFKLNRLNVLRLNPSLPSPRWVDEISEIAQLSILEGKFIEEGRRKVVVRAAEVPADSKGFMEWFEELKRSGPGQKDELFPWLAEECSMDEMKWFLTQEVAGEAGFEDLTDFVCQDVVRAHPNTTVEAIVIPSIDVCEAIEEAENLMRAEQSMSTAGPTSRAAGGARP